MHRLECNTREPRNRWWWRLLALPVLFTAYSARAQDSWSYEMIPFLWASGLDGRTGVNDLVVSVDASFDDLIELVDVGASMRVAARRHPVGWFGEASYVELESETAAVIDAAIETARPSVAQRVLAIAPPSADRGG